MHPWLRPALAGLLLALSATAGGAQQPVPTVTTVTAEAQDFTLTTRLPGRIKASTIAEVRPQVSGIIRKRLFEEGASVAEDEPLYQIEDETYAATVDAARAAVAQAKANFDNAVLEAKRAEDLMRSSAGSQQRLDSAVATRDSAAAAVKLAEAQLKSTEIDLDRTTIRAPIAGVIGLSQTTTGALVAAQQATALATIRALDPVYVDVTQSAVDLMRWNTPEASARRAAQEVSLILPGGAPFPWKGKLQAAEPQVEPTTGMVTLRIAIPNPDHLLLPGLFVEIEMPEATAAGAILVPQDAVMRDPHGAAFAWVVEDGKVAVRGLTILAQAGSDWVTTGGLAPGDRIITSGFQKIQPGAAVEIAPERPAEGN